METLLALPGSVWIYLALYLVTMLAHAVFAGYVLGGSVLLVVSRLRGADAVNRELTDWLPFAVGVAITAGVAPLLFVQILYRDGFYAANLILFYRWLAVLPVLMGGFYLLYVLKSGKLERRRPWLTTAATVLAAACFCFTGYSFVELHSLSLASSEWPAMYAASDMVYQSVAVALRFAMFVCASVAIAALGLRWQLGDRSPQWLSLAMLVAVVGMLGFAIGYVRASGADVPAGLAIAVAVGALAWASAAGAELGGAGGRLARIVATVGAVVAGAALLLCRELIRVRAVDLDAVVGRCEQASNSGGAVLFVVFLAINGAAIAWCLRLGRASSSEAKPA